MKVRFLMIAEIDLADEGYDAESAERDAQKMLELYTEAAGYTVGTEFGVSMNRASDDDLLDFPIWEIPDDEGWRSLVPPVIEKGGDQSPA